jgi:photosystem II stability/assembly factor-like uncharacterized protein
MAPLNFFIMPILVFTLLTITGCFSSSDIATVAMSSSTPSISNTGNSEPALNSVSSISHAHGLAVDAGDSSKVYIATHHGLLILKNGKDLYRIGDVQDDFMGFSAHTKNPKTFFTSGHPKRGGNMGIQRSDDGGMSWEKISDGASGPVDFHSMTLSPANSDILYGWYGALQRSTDGGMNWKLIPATLQNVISLTADPHDEKVLYASTTNGLQFSKDQGETWSVLSGDLRSGAVTVIAIDPVDKQNMISFSEAKGLARSIDEGNSWVGVQSDLGIVLYIAFDQNTTDTVYALNRENNLYKSINGGIDWDLIR